MRHQSRLFILLAIGMIIVSCTTRDKLEPGEVCQDEKKALLIEYGPTDLTRELETYHPLDHHGALHRCGRKSAVGATFFEEIYEYKTERAAQREYERQFDILFYEDAYVYSWEVPTEVILLQLKANTYHIACAEKTSGVEICSFLAQYGTIIIRSSVNRTIAKMSIEDFIFAIQDMDKKMLLSKE